MDSLCDLQNHVNALEGFTVHRDHMSERRAVGFFKLYEAALTKEDSINSAISGEKIKKQSISKMSAEVRQKAAAEFNRLTALPSQKWTWGTDLTTEDIRDLTTPFHFSTTGQHSGYDISLPLGDYEKESSYGPASPFTDKLSVDAVDNTDIPELDLKDIPTHFSHYPLRQEIGDPPATLQLPRFPSPDNVSPFLVSPGHDALEDGFRAAHRTVLRVRP